ncbi:MAG: metalloregulator ArsR/SmtB family transcription factor [Thermoleophilia bacterium]|jgi:ArsR family transcriptional regulator, cadmium/lead-responsive transcriptional repressor|nr:metalloregulator ArsR/SmtB family transcription factor [Thermoleophilia bacterium]
MIQPPPLGGRPAIVAADSAPLTSTELAARLFRVLGDATRLRILRLLMAEGELHQAELVRRLGASQSRVSEHLACLSWCGFVAVARTEGRRAYYAITDPRVAEFLELGEGFLEDNAAEIGCCPVIEDEG